MSEIRHFIVTVHCTKRQAERLLEETADHLEQFIKDDMSINISKLYKMEEIK